jgi:hypothetical protein
LIFGICLLHKIKITESLRLNFPRQNAWPRKIFSVPEKIPLTGHPDLLV